MGALAGSPTTRCEAERSWRGSTIRQVRASRRSSTRSALDDAYPATVHVGDASYRADYDLDKDQVLLRMLKGSRRELPPLG